MSKADFDSVKADFLKELDTAQTLAKFQAPTEARQKQMADIAAGQTLSQSRLSNLHSFILEDGQEILWEGIFTARGLYHSSFNPDNVKSFSYPTRYNMVVRYARLIHEDRAKKAPPPPPVTTVKGSASKKTRSSSKKISGTVEESDDEVNVIVGASAGQSQPAVSDERAQPYLTNFFCNSARWLLMMMLRLLLERLPRTADALRQTLPSFTKKTKGNKRARVDSNPQFHEDSFLTSATTEFYNSANVQAVTDKASSIVEMSSDFEENPLAMRKRMYFIMVEMAVIHEQLRSHLVRRSQLIGEGETLRERLTTFPISVATGVDSMVPLGAR
ncbi:hypothetical protein K438DRAFT_1774342 [Mycena galopus ATCC 62051]|nr:hypothetical protein K438DRAFT_1774342 [Mycena galopus ATCC 62051]